MPGDDPSIGAHNMGLESPLHIILLVGIVMLIFGAKRLPEVGRSLGSGLRGFKDAVNDTPSISAGAADPEGADESRPHRAPVQGGVDPPG